MNPVLLDTYFDKIFYINLESDTIRHSNMIRQFSEFGITNYERVAGIEINAEQDRQKYRNFIKAESKYILGQLGCRASHIACFKLARDRGYKRILILEDDAIFLHDPNMLMASNSRSLDNWDMLYFGGLVEPMFRNQVVCTHAYAVQSRLFDDIIAMGEASGMEIDNFYAKIIQHMSYNYNASGKYNIQLISPFNTIVQDKTVGSNIQSN